MAETKISKIILIILAWILTSVGLLLVADKLSDNYVKEKGLDKCYCQYDVYLPTDYCWGYCRN